MTCGSGLGILVVFLVQAECVCCFWAKEAHSFQRSNTYAGFPPPDGRLIKSVSYPQDQVRQGFISPHSAQSRSFNTGPAVGSGSGPGLSVRGSTQAVSQSGRSSVRLVQSSPVFKTNRQMLFSPRANAQTVPKQSLGFSVAGGTSQRLRSKNPSDLSRSWSTEQGMQHSSKYPSSSSRSIQGPRESYSFRPVSPQSAAQEPPRAATKIPLYHSQVGSSVLFDPVAPGQRGRSLQMHTYARGPAKRVFSNRRSEARGSSPRSQAWKPSVHQGLRPRSWLQTYKTSHNLAVPRSSTVGVAAQGFTPATVYEIPERFGGFAIRRLKEPADQNQVTVQKQQLQIPAAAPQWVVPSTPYSQNVHPMAKWTRVKL
ncbi:uncharacterized protein LOC108244726 isoform X2 [Kryptolebias marmoratus]|uniref:uncharacterized protein LOC108244726 isoform X2 n=1 Tax=Kryptolebias marmoratus TaxID=37003 RepID=UPI0007F894EA|nr:uncharacterized protein LOC108244726 isoform X2 [Kryptolebias marmoratus]